MSEPPGPSLTLTVNRRLARSLRQQHALAQREKGLRSWRTPDILPLTGWLQRCHDALRQEGDATLPAPLGAYQEQLLWEQVLVAANPRPGREALQPRVAAALCQSAHDLLLRFQVDDADWVHAPLPETRALAGWLPHLRERLREGGWIAAGAVTASVAAAVRQGCLPVPAAISMAGFDVLAPVQRSLLRSLRERGCAVTQIPPALPRGTPRAFLPATPRDELVQAAGWARQHLLRDADTSVAVLIPDLAARREQVLDVFEDVLQPHWYRGEADDAALFELSLGEPLDRHPLARAALAVLAAVRGRLSLEEAGTLLLGDAVSGARVESAARARVDAWLRRNGERTVTTRRLIQLCRSRRVLGAAGAAAQLAQRLDALSRGAQRRTRRLPSQWAAMLSGWLDALGWPGDVTLSSRRYQAVQAVRETVEGLAGLDGILGNLGLADFGSHCRRMLAQQIFQYAALGSPRVQVVGALEAVGVQVDALWIAGMHEGLWPPRVEPNPLLPLALQRGHGMPGSEPAREIERAEAIARRWLGSAVEVCVSHPRFDTDRPLRPAPMFATLFADAPAQATSSPVDLARRMAAAPAALQRVQDELLPALAPGSLARGGSAALRDFCACPFQSAARHRLGASAVEEPVHALDPRQRGIMVHRLLHLLWQRLGDSRRLVQLDEDALAELVTHCVDTTLDGVRRELPQTLTPGLRRIEAQRLQRLCTRWLALERERPHFQVLGAEQAQRVHLGGLRFDVRIDRIDRLDQGGLLLVDYKTGRCAAADWWGERPREPQLPLYSVAFRFPGAETELAAVSYACLRSDMLGFVGIGEGEGVPRGVRSAERHGDGDGDGDADGGMESITRRWHGVLEARARELREGVAAVQPRDAGACRYCELHGLCRIDESHALPGSSRAGVAE
jgi:probable DNA repair protein